MSPEQVAELRIVIPGDWKVDYRGGVSIGAGALRAWWSGETACLKCPIGMVEGEAWAEALEGLQDRLVVERAMVDAVRKLLPARGGE